MMEKFLRPERFDGSLDTTPAEWSHWFRTFSNFLESIGGDPAPDRLKLLINYISPSVYSHIIDCSTYTEAINVLKSVYVKPTNVIFARHQLASRKQKTGESLDLFLQNLKLLTKDCEFRAVSADVYTQEAIRDAFISGLYSPMIRQRLLEKETLSLTEAVQLARSLDLAQRNAELYLTPTTPDNVSAAVDHSHSSDAVAVRPPSDVPVLPDCATAAEDTEFSAAVSRASCYFCGRSSHPRPRCPARDAVCHKCGKKGHFSRVCKSSRGSTRHAGTSASTTTVLASMGSATTPSRPTAPMPRGFATINFPRSAMAADSTTATTSRDSSAYSTAPTRGTAHSSINRISDVLATASPPHGTVSPPRRATISVRVNNMFVNALVDSGSTSSFMHPDIVKRLGLSITPTEETITMASSPLVSATLGHCLVDLSVHDNEYSRFKLSVLPHLCSNVILGQDFMEMHKSVVFDLNGPRPKLTVCSVACMNLEPPSLFSNLTPDIKPLSNHTRRFCKSDEAFIRKEVHCLLQDGVIEKSNSPWRAQVLVTKDERHKCRMVVDYSRTINRFTLLDAYPIPRISDLVHKMAKYKYFSKLDLKSAYYQVPLKEDEKLYTAFEADGQLYQYTRIPFGLTNAVAAFQRIINSIISDNKLDATFAYIDDVIICGKDQEDHDRNLECFRRIASQYNLTLNEDKCQYNLTEICYLGYCISDGLLRPDPERLKPLMELPVPSNTASLQRTLGLFAYYSVWIPSYSSRIVPLLNSKCFPLDSKAIQCFESLKKDINKASVAAFDETLPLQVETDASATALAATLSQTGRPVAFFSRTLTASERLQPAIEREATAIVEAVRKWRLFLIGRRFTIVTDQQAVSFMFNVRHSSKIKNDKILRWRLDLSEYQYDIMYRPGVNNIPCDTLSRVCSAATSFVHNSLEDIHASLCHPGVTRLHHFIRSKNLTYSLDDVKRICSQCSICSQIKPRYFRPPVSSLIRSLHPFDRISVDFIGPKPSSTKNKYLLVMVDEYSRFPFVYPCADMSTLTVISCFQKLFSLFGCPSSVHSDRGAQFMSKEVSNFLLEHGVVMTHSTPYHPQGNGQCERMNGTIWKAVQLALATRSLPVTHWELVLDCVLHSIRSLLCTATNQTPHERLFSFPRKSSNGYSLPSWLSSPGPILLRKFVRTSKSDPLVEPVDLLSATPHYAQIRHPNGRETTVSTKDLAPFPRDQMHTESPSPQTLVDLPASPIVTEVLPIPNDQVPQTANNSDSNLCEPVPIPDAIRRSSRVRKPVDRLNL